MPLSPSIRLTAVALVVALPLAAQQPAATFTIDDALNVTTYQIGDLSEDGRWLFATSSMRRDNIGVDSRPRALWLFDTQSGQARAWYPIKRSRSTCSSPASGDVLRRVTTARESPRARRQPPDARRA